MKRLNSGVFNAESVRKHRDAARTATGKGLKKLFYRRNA
jgi:hypothetical protein